MNGNVVTIMRKEFARFFLDKRLVFTTILLPGLLFFIIYSFIGRVVIANQAPSGQDGNDHLFSIYTVNLPASIESAAEGHNVYIGEKADNRDLIKDKIRGQEADALVIFPLDFDEIVEAYDPRSGSPAPDIEIYYNSSSKTSAAAFKRMSEVLNGYKYSIANKFDINNGPQAWDLSTDAGRPDSTLASMIPMLLLILLFSGCISIAPESIAGEKERGTMATLLATPVKRGELAVGKVLSLAIISLLYGLSTLTGLVLSISGVLRRAGLNVHLNAIGVSGFLFLLSVVLSTVIFDVTLVSIISTFAMSVKESVTMTTPLMLVNMLIGFSAMANAGVKASFYYYLIPLYNSVQCMQGIFMANADTANILLTVAVNLIYSCTGGFILAKMFASERIIYSR